MKEYHGNGCYPWGLMLLTLLLVMPVTVTADIYMFVDKDGVTHFTNTPTSPKFQMFIKGRHPRSGSTLNKTRYDHLIKKAARKFNVSFSLIKAIIEVESGYNARAVSSKGARGLMQIMPSHFNELNISDPFEPFQNIMGGTRYLTKLMHQYKGNVAHALAAYNAGPGAVDKYNGIPPFRETRNYVRKVMALHRIYRLNNS